MSATTALPLMDEKPVLYSSFLAGNPVTSLISSLNQSFHERRATLGLTNPGTVENISREVLKDVFLNNYMFTGMRADFSKSFSMDPIFQTSHAFAMGTQGVPPYTFAAIFGTNKVSRGPLVFPFPFLFVGSWERIGRHPQLMRKEKFFRLSTANGRKAVTLRCLPNRGGWCGNGEGLLLGTESGILLC
jgi:hypothetical protein